MVPDLENPLFGPHSTIRRPNQGFFPYMVHISDPLFVPFKGGRFFGIISSLFLSPDLETLPYLPASS